METFDLVERTSNFCVKIRKHLYSIKFNSLLIDDFRQLIRSSGAISANYIEGSQHLGPKDFKMRITIARKEASETLYWLNILNQTTGAISNSKNLKPKQKN